MATIIIVVSDLHLADNTSVLECFGDSHQAAFDGLLRLAAMPADKEHQQLDMSASTSPVPDATATQNGAAHTRAERGTVYRPYNTPLTPLSQADRVELIINGDCFDFLVTAPYNLNGVIDMKTALEKLEKIIAAHSAFFATLAAFVAVPGCTVTFLPGNHDLELCFAEVRERISMAIVGTPQDERIAFCSTRFYRPLPDVYVEHGNYYDFWNHATLGLWNEQGQPVTLQPQSITLPVGSRYWQEAAHSISLRYPYFDHFEPSINLTRQVALLCLLDPELVIKTAKLTMRLLSSPRPALSSISELERYDPVLLYGATMLDFAAYQEDVVAHKTDWWAGSETMQVSPEAFLEFTRMRDALALSLTEAAAAICTPATYTMGEAVARGMQDVLKSDPALRYAIAGHTHMGRIELVNGGNQAYLNTASWTTRLALPAPRELTGEYATSLLNWLRRPHGDKVLLRDVTQLTFALITADDGPASAKLCAWEDGTYRVLA